MPAIVTTLASVHPIAPLERAMSSSGGAWAVARGRCCGAPRVHSLESHDLSDLGSPLKLGSEPCCNDRMLEDLSGKAARVDIAAV
jgi:hypothetical protein